MKRQTAFEQLSKKLNEQQVFDTEDYKKIFSITNVEKLLELIRVKYLTSDDRLLPQYRQVIFMPIAANIEKYGSYFTIKDAINKLTDMNSLLVNNDSFSVAIDRWHGKFFLSDLLSLLAEIKETCPTDIPFSYICPSTYDILAALEARSETICFYTAVEDILREFLAHGLNNIDGGQDLIIHKIAAEMGFSCCIAHVLKLRILKKGIKKYYTSFLLPDILYIKNEILVPGSNHKWFITIDQTLSVFSKNIQNNFQKNITRFLAAARIILPDNCKLRVPLSRFDQTFPDIAKKLQVEDFGDFALDKNTAETLQLIQIHNFREYLDATRFQP
ncbi:MAG: hypothetical protein IT292_12390 [Deltaproteobacteria bacterium]|nr:hypothetical protein [Deltaproteobacteria bacterium]